MPELPAKRYLRRGEVRDYLGIDGRAMRKLVDAKVLTPRYLQGRGRAFFLSEEVRAAEESGKLFSTSKTGK